MRASGSVRPVLRTERLLLEPMTLEHLPFLQELDGDAEVLRHILGRARTAPEADAFWTAMIEQQGDGLLGMWVGAVDDEPVGWWSLWPRGADEAEAGWRLARRWWRRGLAREGARAVLEHGFGSAGLRRVFAETMAVNVASRGVMTALGMVHVRTEVRQWDDPLPGAELGEVIYEIDRGSWPSRT